MDYNDIHEETQVKVYVKVDSENRVTAINSDVFLTDLTDYIEIDSGIGDKYTYAQGNYLDKPILTSDGIYRYKYIDEKIVERTDEEIEQDRQSIPIEPTLDERMAELEQSQSDQDDIIMDMVMSEEESEV